MITKSEYKLLKRFADARTKDTYLGDLPDVQKGRIRNLCYLGLIDLSPKDHDDAFIGGTTPAGRHECELYQEQRTRDRWTVALAIVAIVISIIAIFAQLLDLPLSELLVSWLKPE